MRLKNLLTFLVLLSVSLGMRAVDWTNQPSSVTITEEDDGKTLVINSTNGAEFQTFWAANIANANSGNYKKIKYVGSFGINGSGFSYLQGSSDISSTELTIPVIDVSGVTDMYGDKTLTNQNVTTVIYNGSSNITSITDNGGNDVILVNKGLKTATARLSGSNELASAMAQIDDVDLDKLTITGTLSSDDAAVLNATAVEASGVTSLTANLTDIQGTATYMALPAGFSTDDLQALKTNNPNLQVAMSLEDLGTDIPKLTMHSFQSNKVTAACNALNNQAAVRSCKYVSMTGSYGDIDLYNPNDNTGKNFGDVAVWDFTGASFDACNVDASVCDGGPYYASNDPFCDYGTLTLSNTYPSNAFYYFKNYSTKVVDITLPTGITELPPSCMTRLGEENGPNYKLIKGMTTEEFNAANSQYSDIAGFEAGKWMPIEKVVIPDNIVTVGYEAFRQSVIQSIVMGSGVKEVQGGAFKLNRLLESVDCKPGINNCYLGDQAFNECNNMKHIQLSEGIVSLGANCFNNSQNLESIRLPETLLYIGNLCFKDGHALSSITIPENVEKIGKQAFALTALKDIYLTTTDPAKVPVIYTAGKGFGDNDCTFSANEMYGNNSCPYGLSDTPEPANSGFGSMTWDDAVDWYYAHGNLIGVLHYPTELAAKVRADLSQQYAYRCEVTNDGGFGLPSQSQATTVRSSIDGTYNTTNDKGVYTSDGWAQFALMKEFVPNKDVVFVKEYDDVWYTMCFPFDLTDEQLAGAFNETFNIVDFSAVEIRDEEDGKKNLVLHFNNVAETVYKDEDNNIYVRKRDGAGGLTGNVIREKDGAFYYNVYYKVENGTPNTSVEYHHFSQNTSTSAYKTKTFKAANSDDVLLIDGYLASAGHPYMIHPSTGTAAGSPKVRCYFSGISWKPEVDGGYDNLYNAQARTVDLGGAAYSGSTPETITYVTEGSKFIENNFDQSPYAGYAGQTYTFKGNWREVTADAPAKPTVENEGLEAYPPYPTLGTYPDVTEYTDLYPNGPVEATQGPEPQEPTEAEMTEPTDPRLNPVENPADDTNTYSTEFQALFNTVHRTGIWNGSASVDYTYGEDLVSMSITDFAEAQYAYLPPDYSGTLTGYKIKTNEQALLTYWNINQNNLIQESDFNNLKSLCTSYSSLLTAYNNYLAEINQYDNVDYPAYLANHQLWEDYRTNHAKWAAFNPTVAHNEYLAALETYNQAVLDWQDDCDDVDDANATLISTWESQCETIDEENEATLANWEASVQNYKVLIPQYAYFLARPSNSAYPKYYREMAPDNVARTTGRWTQYSAVIIPNAAALAGIEAGVDPNVQSGVKGYNIAFNEDYEGEFDPTEIKDIVAEAEEKGQKVEYMNIVYSINGEIISRGTSSLSGLPKGMYIINGKKYLVK